MIIKTHKALAEQIAGKRILHLNSLGKDSAICLEWLANYAHPSHIVSVYFEFLTPNPYDDVYLEYLKKRYPSVEFVTGINPHDLGNICQGYYQDPIEVINFYNNLEYNVFDFDLVMRDFKKQYDCDFICMGHSRSESFRRAVEFHKKGILREDKIFPIGMMSKKEIISLIRSTGLKLHPVYKLSGHTLDYPSYYKFRNQFVSKPYFYEEKLKNYPLLKLDEYRWRVLFNKP